MNAASGRTQRFRVLRAGTAGARTVAGMQTLHRGRPLARRSRAATMIEFAFVLPIFTFLMLFVVDMGHIVLVSSAMQDAAFTSARSGAQVGGGGLSPNGSRVCYRDGASCRNSEAVSYDALMDAAEQIPGYGKLGAVTDMRLMSGAMCANTPMDNHVTVRVDYSTSLVTPGLQTMLNLFSGKGGKTPDGNWQLHAIATSRCEVYY